MLAKVGSDFCYPQIPYLLLSPCCPACLSRRTVIPVNGVRSVYLPPVGERPIDEGGIVLLCGRGSPTGVCGQQEASAGEGGVGGVLQPTCGKIVQDRTVGPTGVVIWRMPSEHIVYDIDSKQVQGVQLQCAARYAARGHEHC